MISKLTTNYLLLKNKFCVLPQADSWFCAWSCIAGILTQQPLNKVCSLLLMSFVGIIYGYSTKRFKKIASIRMFLIMLFFAIGYARFQWHYQSFEKSFTTLEQRLLSGTAIVLSSERLHLSFRYNSLLRISLTSLADGNLPTQRTLLLYIKGGKDLMRGDTIRFTKLSIKKQAKGGYKWYLYKEGLVGSIYADTFRYTRIDRPFFATQRWLISLRDSTTTTLSQKLSPKSSSLFLTIFMGTKDPNKISGKIRKQFAWWGVVHYLARSGLHIVVLVGTWGSIFRYLQLSYRTTELFLLFFVLIYHLLSWSAISFIRALSAFYLYRTFNFVGRSVRLLHILALTSLAVLIYNPFQLFFLDFQLSFGLTCALAWFTEIHYQIKRLKHLKEDSTLTMLPGEIYK